MQKVRYQSAILLLVPEALSGSWIYSQDAVLVYQFQFHTGSKSVSFKFLLYVI